MSEKIGNVIPPPLRFEMGAPEPRSEPVRAFLLVTIDQEDLPRVAVLAPTEVKAIDERNLSVTVHSKSTTQKNLRRSFSALLWCVLDGAAYSLRGGAKLLKEEDEYATFEMSVTEVLRDFYPDAPMISGPTFKRVSISNV
jgi:hypothetical protein